MKKRIFYHDTDCGGVVYYGNYLKFLEEARTEYMEQRGFSVKKLMDDGFVFVVARQEIEYKAPAFYDDVLTVETTITDISSIRVEFSYAITNQHGKLTTKARTVLVCVGQDIKPRVIPPQVRAALKPA
ncbi:MAG: thioesterase family protein [Elusimicrobiaceae bacterium]|nr:thioesterase family protein [Elusimicrobiaceae bacterium]